MANLETLISVVDRGDAAGAVAAALEILKSVRQEGNSAERCALMEFVFDVADWLFEGGHAADAAALYAAVFGVLENLGEQDAFALARQLDRMVKHLLAAGEVHAAREALLGALTLTESEASIDRAAVAWRLRLLAEIETQLGRAENAETALEKAEAIERRGHSRELTSSTPAPSVPAQKRAGELKDEKGAAARDRSAGSAAAMAGAAAAATPDRRPKIRQTTQSSASISQPIERRAAMSPGRSITRTIFMATKEATRLTSVLQRLRFRASGSLESTRSPNS